jgi:hypothetical protein
MTSCDIFLSLEKNLKVNYFVVKKQVNTMQWMSCY